MAELFKLDLVASVHSSTSLEVFLDYLDALINTIDFDRSKLGSKCLAIWKVETLFTLSPATPASFLCPRQALAAYPFHCCA